MDLKAELLKQIELGLDKIMEDKYEPLMLSLKAEVEKEYPNPIAVAVIEAVMPTIMPMIKTYLLKKIEEISPLV